jgi:DNA-binding MarR family transcriptional regulator
MVNTTSWYDRVVTGAAKMEALFAELFEAAGTSRRWGEILASRQGLTQAQWQTLWIAATSPLTVPQIARRLGVSRQNVQRVANDLAAAGMATFGQNPDHKSSPLLELTPAGRSALDRINTAAAGSNQALLQQLTEPGIDQLRHLVTHLSQAIHELIDAEHQAARTPAAEHAPATLTTGNS